MEALRTILKWALPSSKFAYKMLATSAEVFCRHSFGRRYMPTMLLSFVICMAALKLFSFAETPPYPGLVDGYLLIFFALLLYHFVQMRRTGPGIHSTSSGRSWPFWSRFNFNPNAVKMLIEPLINFLAGVAILPANRLLSVWLQLAGICLFIKGSLAYNQFRNRVQDTLDARIDGEGIGTAARQQAAPQRTGEQAVNTVELADSPTRTGTGGCSNVGTTVAHGEPGGRSNLPLGSAIGELSIQTTENLCQRTNNFAESGWPTCWKSAGWIKR